MHIKICKGEKRQTELKLCSQKYAVGHAVISCSLLLTTYRILCIDWLLGVLPNLCCFLISRLWPMTLDRIWCLPASAAFVNIRVCFFPLGPVPLCRGSKEKHFATPSPFLHVSAALYASLWLFQTILASAGSHLQISQKYICFMWLDNVYSHNSWAIYLSNFYQKLIWLTIAGLVNVHLRVSANLIMQRTLQTFLSFSACPLWRNSTPVVLPGWFLTSRRSLHMPYLWFVPNDLKCMFHQQHRFHPPCVLRLYPRPAPSSSRFSIQASLSPSSLSCSMPPLHWDWYNIFHPQLAEPVD